MMSLVVKLLKMFTAFTLSGNMVSLVVILLKIFTAITLSGYMMTHIQKYIVVYIVNSFKNVFFKNKYV